MQAAQDRDPELEKEIAQETLKQQGPRKHKYKSQLVQGAACKDKEREKKQGAACTISQGPACT